MSQTLGSWPDYIVIVIYFVFILLFGSFFGRYTKTTKDFFFGGQRFSWWLIAMSCVATVVGSYSFVKYAAAGFKFGFSTSMSYLNDWISLPLFILGWLPIIYFSRVSSIPEYFERRFDKKTRMMATIIMLVYLIGYIGINLLTLGIALTKILGFPLMPTVIVIAIISGVYLHFGGQTAVIFTDLAQAFILIFAGILLFVLGLIYMGGFQEFISNLSTAHKLPFAQFNSPHSFSFIGIFWQDGVANSTAFYFMNQGVMMRFLSVKSVKEGRKAITFVVLFLMPLAVFAIANAGWLGRALVNKGLLPPDTNAQDIFVTVANLVAVPGVFGFIMAALMAALMSTVDTLINAVSAVTVNDIYRPYIKKNADDKHYLKVAQLVAILAAVIGVLLVPIFRSFGSIMEAHAQFTASITPPMVVVIVLGAFWKRFTPKAAFYTLLMGTAMIIFSLIYPNIITPLSHGVSIEGGYKYMRALYALLVSGIIAVVISYFTKPKDDIDGLVIDSIDSAMIKYKGAQPNLSESSKIKLQLKKIDGVESVELCSDYAKKLNANVGDLLHVSDKRWYYGGLKSIQVKLNKIIEGTNAIHLSADLIENGQLNYQEEVVVERII